MEKQTHALFAVLLFITTNLFSQGIGINAGTAYNYFMSDQQHVRGKPCLTAGVAYFKPFGEIELKVGLEYLQLGGGILIVEDETRFGLSFADSPMPRKVRDANVTLHTLNLPVLVNFKVLSNDNFSVSVGLGPEVSYLLNATSKELVTGDLGSGVYATYSQTVNETRNYQNFNFAVTGDIRLDIPFGENNIFLDCRYRHGINPVRKEFSYLDIAEVRSDLLQRSFIISLGYKINLSTTSTEE